MVNSKSEVEALTQASVWPWAVTSLPEPHIPHSTRGTIITAHHSCCEMHP